MKQEFIETDKTLLNERRCSFVETYESHTKGFEKYRFEQMLQAVVARGLDKNLFLDVRLITLDCDSFDDLTEQEFESLIKHYNKLYNKIKHAPIKRVSPFWKPTEDRLEQSMHELAFCLYMEAYRMDNHLSVKDICHQTWSIEPKTINDKYYPDEISLVLDNGGKD